MVILMSPTEYSNLWNAEFKNHNGRNFKCKYIIKGDLCPSSDIIWRPQDHKRNRKKSARNSWTKSFNQRHSASWTQERWRPLQPFIAASDEEKIVNCFKSSYAVLKKFVADLAVDDEFESDSKSSSVFEDPDSSRRCLEKEDPLEEPWLLQSPLLSHHVANSNAPSSNGKVKSFNQSTVTTPKDAVITTNTNFDPSKILPERHDPVEEPWLFQSPICLPVPNAKLVCELPKNEVPVNIEAACAELQDQHLHGKMLPDEGISMVRQDSVSTVILINSSICTMQRIAILEDGNLVELLLEPVKDDVHLDSVFLGVITKLVPHMGGAFVNIGSHRSAFMDIVPHRAPFTFSQFSHDNKEREENGSVFVKFLEQAGSKENESSSDDAELRNGIEEHQFGHNIVQDMHDDFEEVDVEEDFDLAEVLKGSIDGSVVRQGMEADSEQDLDQLDVCNPGNQTINKILPVEMDTKDCRDTNAYKNNWNVRKGTKIIVQVVKEGLGTKGPRLTAYPRLRSRFWVLLTRSKTVGISRKVAGVERARLKLIAKTLQPKGFGLTLRTVAAGHSIEELRKDLESLLSTWKNIMEHAKSSALAADEGVEGAVPVLLHSAMGQTLSVVQDYFNDKVKSMVVDSPRTYHEVTKYLQETAPDLCDRVELYSKRTPLFDEYNIEEEINGILSKRVPLANGGYLVIEQTEALFSIDVNGGQCVLGQGNSQENAILNVNLAAAKQIARELRLRDIGGIIVVDFIDMEDDLNRRLVYQEVKRAVERDRSVDRVSELSRIGLMEITRKRVRPSVTFMISEPCTCCHATGRVEALETSFSKIEHEICRSLAFMDSKAVSENPKSWPRFILRVDQYMCSYLTTGRRTRLALLSSSLKVWILLKVDRAFTRGGFQLEPFREDKDKSGIHRAAISMLRKTDAGNRSPKSKEVTIYPIKKWKAGGK